ncbi:hypothetical protein Gotri_024486 [Gossypium trilobum]|uniref:SHSP domain-containing protein n=1 Tax=Gossypium trilobum TaxID=34281 RepID=A0A7J9DNB9_9ROSI|nr:hypothetical protein [Gossypium trilobum]
MIPTIFGNNRRSSVFDPFSLDLWDPFKEFDFPTVTSFPSLSRENSALVNTRVDWKETPEAHVFKADLPGMKKEEVKVEIEDDRVLQISGERHVEKEDKNDTWHRVERSSGKFSRRFRLPENVRMGDVKASMENGVLTITVPKVEMKKPEIKSVEVSARAVWLGSNIGLKEISFSKMVVRKGKSIIRDNVTWSSKDVLEMVSILWSIWFHQNGCCFKSYKPKPMQVLSKAKNCLFAFESNVEQKDLSFTSRIRSFKLD